ncbi:NAD(P)/FAD-dependent oxidoreductase [Nocardioides sp. LMS-CY]|uniref:flavin-containing monooxygenase n=1 Tax=Nocardioides sp. (strain LMS-CY) TaxID=2840457 RepID=UPI001C000DAB|nr:NAD(P)/FAD-dependent oxidoreductase [Nocardioides sp. LMS-CY]QWF22775.1 NAD(P)/FAD-dependent oxidoreductase [Nocardioides sp. LMS-CY]
MTSTAPSETPDLDYLIIGAGVCGLYQLHQLLEVGVSVRVVDSNAGLGGTWYNNRYPGCRFDSESYTYQYSFSDELLAEWDWKERFASQAETLAYLEYVADKFDLRRHITFNARVARAEWVEDGWFWRVTLADGEQIRARFVLCAMGLLSVPTYPRVPGVGTFGGVETHTFDWPEDLDVTGKRVIVIGTGASGVQVITDIADQVEQLIVLQRDANWCAPLGNGPITAEEMAKLRASYDEIFDWCRSTPAGFIHRPDRTLSTDVTREERLRHWNDLYDNGQGASLYMGNYRDTMMEAAPNRELSEFVADRIRQRVHDPEVAELLIPKDHGFGNKRVAGESGFYEVFNQPNVELVDLMAYPIKEVTETGIRLDLGDGRVRDLEVDVIVYATGFDAVTGPFDRIDFRGVDGVRLKDQWRDGPETTVGVQATNFPNLFMLVGPQSGSATANFPRGIEDVVNWMTATVRYLEEHDIARFEGRREAEIAWVDHVREINSLLLLAHSKSWFNGHNINLDRDERPRVMVYLGGAPRYRRRLQEEIDNGYPSFELRSRADAGREAELLRARPGTR